MALRLYLACIIISLTTTFQKGDIGVTTKNAQITQIRGKLTTILLFSPDRLLQDLTTLGNTCSDLSNNASRAFSHYFNSKIPGTKSQTLFHKCLMTTDVSANQLMCKKINQLNFISSRTQIQLQTLRALNTEIKVVFQALRKIYTSIDRRMQSDLFLTNPKKRRLKPIPNHTEQYTNS